MYKIKDAPRALGFDASTYVDLCSACHLMKAGYRTAFRYVRWDRRVKDTPDSNWPISLSKLELKQLVYDVGFKVSLVQFAVSESQGGGRGEANGKRYGDAAGYNARELGTPEGITVWCDAENWTNQSRADIIEYLNGWADGCATYGYKPGLYVGSGLPGVTGDDLWSLPGYTAYWRAASIVSQVPNRGWTVSQGVQIEVYGTNIDQDMISLDHRATSKDSIFKVIGK